MVTQSKTIEQKFKKLTDIEHVLLRPARYLGVTKPTTTQSWVVDEKTKKMMLGSVTFNPGFLKMYDEIISNSSDFSKTPEGKHVDTIRVEVNRVTGELSVYDNGGIPVVMHKDANMWLPVMLFKELKAGSNFNDEEASELTGQNGEGAGLTNIFSTYFDVDTCDTKNRLKVKFSNNNHTQSEPKIDKMPAGTKGYTRITWMPDYKRLEMEPVDAADNAVHQIDDGNFAVLYKRAVDIAAVNSHLKVYFNGERIQIRSFKDYVAMYVPEDENGKEQFIYDENEKWKVGLAHSDDGFQQTSFVNSSHVKGGGTHVEHVIMSICYKLRDLIKKKHKVEVKPSEMRQHMHLFLDCRIDKPRYSEQTKDNLVTSIDSKNGFEVTDKFVRKVMDSPIIQSVLDWAMAKEQALKNAELRKLNKGVDKDSPKNIEKLQDATERKNRGNCMLFLAEGDSAAGAIPRNKDTVKTMGIYPLRGKPLNVSGIDTLKLVANAEFKNMMTILGLKLGEEVKRVKDGKWVQITLNGKKIIVNESDCVLDNEKWCAVSEIPQKVTAVSTAAMEEYKTLVAAKTIRRPADIRYGAGIAIVSDQDLDGFHIQGLLMNMIREYWPEMFEMGLIHRFQTPLVKVFLKKETLNFYTEIDFKVWKEKNDGKVTYKSKYYKGLGTSTKKEFEEYFSNVEKHLLPLTFEDADDFDALDLAFNHARADDRKNWLSLRTGEQPN